MPGILMFNSCYEPPFDEGVKRSVHHLRRELARLTDLVMVTTAPTAPDDAVVVPRRPLRFIKCLRRLCRKHRPEVVLYVPDAYLDRHTVPRLGVLRMAVGKTPIAMLTLQPNTFDLPVRLMLRLWRPDVLLTQTAGDRSACERFGIRYATLPPAVNTVTFRPVDGPDEKRRLRRDYGLPEAGQICLHVGHIRKSRNLDWLLRLTLPEAAGLVVVGSTSRALELDLKARLEARGGKVIGEYLPTIEDVYRLADVYVFPVQERTAAIEMPLSVLEAMACNLPVVTTPFGGLVRCFEGRPGVNFASTFEEFQAGVSQALAAGDYHTRITVERFSWEALAGNVWDTIRGHNGPDAC